MAKLSYPLPPKAIEILKELAEIELQQESDYTYLSSCCAAMGFRHAKRRFQEKSNMEESHFDRLTQLMLGRGYEPDVPATREPEIEFTDLRSAIKYALELCVETMEIYEKKTREMFSIDLCTYQELLCYLSGIQCEIKEWADLWKIFENVEDIKEQRAFEAMYFCAPSCESVIN